MTESLHFKRRGYPEKLVKESLNFVEKEREQKKTLDQIHIQLTNKMMRQKNLPDHQLQT